MPAYRFPILVWRDFADGHTACLVEDARDLAAVGATPAEAIEQMKQYLQWAYNRAPWWPAPDFLDPQLVTVRVEVRPEYVQDERRYPCAEPLPLRVPCVQGKDAGGLHLCAIPTMGIRFNYYEKDAFKGLVTHAVQSALKGLTPQALSRYLAPQAVWLDDVSVQVPRKESKRKLEADLAAVQAVAEPLGERGLRKRFARAWERDAEVAQIVQAVGRQKASVVLVGESGVGKSAALAEAVRKIEREGIGVEAESLQVAEDVEQRSANRYRFWLTSAPRMIAGMQYLGMWQQRCEAIIAQLSEIHGVLCVENLLDLVRTGGHGAGDGLAAFLMPYVQRGELRLVGEATPAELDACRRLLPAFADAFQVVVIPPFSRQQAVAALNDVAGSQKQNLRLAADTTLANVVYRLFRRFMPYQEFPGQASAFMTDLFDRSARGDAANVSADAAVKLFVQKTGLQEMLLRDELPLTREGVLADLSAQVIGQPTACGAAADLIVTFKAGLNDPHRPIGVMLFCGPTGVGKTELAKSISRFLFGHGEPSDRLIRLDMSEYSGHGAADRLLGDPYRGPSDIIRRVRRQPFCVLLLDEIEKAAPEIFDVLLGVFDEGRLTDPLGRLTTFRSAVIIMTSNLGAGGGEAFGLSRTAAPVYASEALGFFRPEFFNRIDAVVSFDPLTEQSIRQITIKELSHLTAREGLQRGGLKLTWTDRLVAMLVNKGFDLRYGARPLQRAIETLLTVPLARYLVEHPDLVPATIHLDVNTAGRVIISH